MKRSTVVVPWGEGLHLRPAAKLVHTAKSFHSTIFLKAGGKIADLRSIVSIISLCATMGATLDLEVVGDDEHDAVRAVEQMFSSHNGADASQTTTKQM
jgi:phosphocarrier protein HPr